jgi:acetolactate synthase-1/2/3 large subunit
MAAEAYFRYSGRMAVLNVTTGPGGINALNGVYGAYVDSMAMLVISGQVKRETYVGSYDLPLRQLGDQEVDIVRVARSLVKYATVLSNPLEVRRVMDKALFLATSGRPGPVWVDVPIDVQSTLIDPAALEPWDNDLEALVDDPAVTPNTVAQIRATLQPANLAETCKLIANRLAQAKRPALLLGNGVRLAGVESILLTLAERLQIPVVTGWNAHDLLPNEHPCYSGRPGTVGDRPGNFTVQNADFVLVLGCRLNIRQISYNWKSFASRAWRAMVDIDPVELNKPTLSLDAAVCADLKDFAPAFVYAAQGQPTQPAHAEYLQWCKARVRRYPTVLPDYQSVRTALNPYIFINELFKALPSDAAVVAGNGSACVIGFQAAQLRKGQRFFTNSGDASMGYDLPAAIGVALARPGKPSYCLAGDGSLMMNLQELQTLVGYRLPVKVLVINNHGYVSIKQTQKAYFADNVFGTGPEDGVSMPDFVRMATGFCIPAIKVDSIEGLRSQAVKDLLALEGPALIDVHVDPEQNFSPKLASRKLDDGTMVSPALEDMAPFLSRDEFAENIIGP